ncbi:MAG: flagellin [Vicinamibacterales bacterium]
MRVIYDLFRDGLSAINEAAERLANARQQVSTGRRVNVASDDPLAVQRAIGEHATIAAVDAYTRTSDAASARLSAADNVLNSIVDKITAALVAGSSARGSAVTPSARAAAAQAVRGLSASLLGDINTQFNGSYLFSGTAANTPAYALVGGAWQYQGDGATQQVEVERGRLVSVSFDGHRIVKGTDSSDLFTALDDLAASIDAGSDAGVGTALASLDRAFDRALQAQGRLGADERGVEDATVRLSALRVAADARRSKLEDANMAEAVSRLTQADTAYKAALGAVSSAERVSLLDYLR